MSVCCSVSSCPGAAEPHVGGAAARPAGGHHHWAAADHRSSAQREGNKVWVWCPMCVCVWVRCLFLNLITQRKRVDLVFALCLFAVRPLRLLVQRVRCSSPQLGRSAETWLICKSPPVSERFPTIPSWYWTMNTGTVLVKFLLSNMKWFDEFFCCICGN